MYYPVHGTSSQTVDLSEANWRPSCNHWIWLMTYISFIPFSWAVIDIFYLWGWNKLIRNRNRSEIKFEGNILGILGKRHNSVGAHTYLWPKTLESATAFQLRELISSSVCLLCISCGQPGLKWIQMRTVAYAACGRILQGRSVCGNAIYFNYFFIES